MVIQWESAPNKYIPIENNQLKSFASTMISSCLGNPENSSEKAQKDAKNTGKHFIQSVLNESYSEASRK